MLHNLPNTWLEFSEIGLVGATSLYCTCRIVQISLRAPVNHEAYQKWVSEMKTTQGTPNSSYQTSWKAMEAAMGSRFVDSILVFLFEFRTNSKQVSCYSHQFQAGFMLFFNLHKTNTKFSPKPRPARKRWNGAESLGNAVYLTFLF